MSVDITKLAQQYMISHRGMDSVLNAAAMEEQKRLRKLMNLVPNMPSSIERYLEDERRQRERYRDLFSSSTQSAIDAILQRGREMERIAELLVPSRATLDAIETSTRASTRMAADVARLAEPLRSVLDQIKARQVLAAPWFTQMESAAQLAKKFIDSWPEDDESDSDVDWEALDQDLEDVQAAIQQLPLRNATNQQLQTTGC